jgi:hypothetical protein
MHCKDCRNLTDLIYNHTNLLAAFLGPGFWIWIRIGSVLDPDSIRAVDPNPSLELDPDPGGQK